MYCKSRVHVHVMEFEIGDGVFVQIGGSSYVVIRQSSRQGKPSKAGIQLTSNSWQNLIQANEEIVSDVKNILTKHQWVSKCYPIGEDIYVSINCQWKCIDIYPWYKGMNRLNWEVITLSFSQWRKLVELDCNMP